MEYIRAGGVIMEILIAMNTVGIALMLFKAIQYWLYDRKKEAHADEILQRFAAIGLEEKDTIMMLVKELLQTYLRPLERGMPTIKIIATTATLFGLLGTVVGVLMAFEGIAKVGMGDPTVFAGGISMALVTTVGGLIVAIIHTVGYNYLIAYINYENNTKLRQFLNDPDSAYDIPADTLSDMTNIYNDISHRTDVKDMIEFYDANIHTYEHVNENFFLYLKMMIDQSPSYQLGFDNDTEYALLNLNSLYTSTLDLGEDGLTLATNELSKTLGNTAGLVETRKGKLYDDTDAAAHVRSVIEAGDILLEKTPFRLTDKLIPGHWGHAAVYIGTEEELIDLGIWNHPVVIPFQEEIRTGKLIDEALRDDVQLNTIEHFLNVDDLAIMHDRTESDKEKADRIILALRQLGKEYDFNFDIETSVKIVCSELIYVTSIMIDWVTEEVVGINTISPDNVAVKSIEDNSIFDITLLYHDGREITTDKKIEMQRLLEEAEDE